MLTRLVSLGVVAMLSVAAPAAAQTAADEARFRAAQDRFDREYRIYREAVDLYQSRARGGDAYRDPPRDDDRAYDDGYRRAPDLYDDETTYDPARDYRAGPQYRERVLSTNDRVYAGYDGRYYCRRPDGTTGLIIGGAAGGVLGNVIDGGRSRVLGTLLGGAAGALAGRAVEQNQVRCR